MDFITSLVPFVAKAGISDAYLRRIVVPQMILFRNALQSHGPSRSLPAKIAPSKVHGNGTFATRCLQQGEVFKLTIPDFRSIIFNDGVQLEECPNTSCLAEMSDFYSSAITKYKTTSAQQNNVRIVIQETETEKLGTLIVLKDVQPEEEMLRSYGAVAWLAMTPDRLCNTLYAQWINENFERLTKESSKSDRFELESSLLASLLVHERKQDFFYFLKTNLFTK